MKNVVALVPMKGHSQRVPNKNLKRFCSRPLLYWVLNSLLHSPHVLEIFVNTDNLTIKNAVKKYFAKKIKIIDRPKCLCGDFVSMNKIIEYDLATVKGGEYFLQTHSTNPLLETATINKAIRKFFEVRRGKFDSLFAVNQIQSRLFDYRGAALNHDPDNLIRTQDLPPVYEENSNLYLFSRHSFAKTSSRIGEKPYLFVMGKNESIDIDNTIDFRIAEYIFKGKKMRRNLS